jgi:hypothetical protein
MSFCFSCGNDHDGHALAVKNLALTAERDALKAKNAALKAKIESVRQLIDNDRATPTHPVPFSRTDLKNHIRAILDSDVLPLEHSDHEYCATKEGE